MLDNVGEKVNFDGRMLEKDEYIQSVQDERIWAGEIFYEVIRIIDGVPLFMEDHYERLCNSLHLAELDMQLPFKLLQKQIQALLRENKRITCNLKIWVTSYEGLIHYFININKHFYPPADYYDNGIRTVSHSYMRRDPNIKYVAQDYRKEIADIMEKQQAFEVLLLNQADVFTEGSRTNLFFVVGDLVYTAPEQMVLKGITRKYTFQAIWRAGAEIVEKPVGRDLLYQVEGVFITGTSIRVLPVAQIDTQSFESAKNPIIIKIGKEFNKITNDYVQGGR